MVEGGSLGSPDAWGRPPADPLPRLSRVAAMSRTEFWVWVVLRGLVFVPGFLFALYFTLGLGYGGIHVGLLLAQLSLAPAAVVCWVLASVGKGGDRWTAGYVAVWVVEILTLYIGARIF